MNYPKVSIIIPTLNAAVVLKYCLKSLDVQDYPKDKIEIIIADGGSIDGTRELAKKYKAKIVENKLKTAEAGKAAGVKDATGDFIALIDSDNYLPSRNWINEMIKPMMEKGNEDVLGSEPWKYTWRKKDGFIDRYCALIGMNDPFVLFLGNYDRFNLLTNKWTEVDHKEEDRGDYLLVTLKSKLPTIGANGTVFRAKYLKKELGDNNYLFDIDILAKTAKEKKEIKFIKTKNGIIHAFCGADVKKFARKQRRRVRDFLFHQSINNRDFDWSLDTTSLFTNTRVLRFVMYNLLVIPVLFDSFRGYIAKKDTAWFFHPLANYITLWEYGYGVIFSLFSNKELDRTNYGQ